VEDVAVKVQANPTVLGEVADGAYVTVVYRGDLFTVQVTGRFERIVWCRTRGRDGGWTDGPLPMDPGLKVVSVLAAV
jgi:hypothetical protein